MNTLLDYQDLDAACAGNAAVMGAAEAHGVLSGMLCVNHRLQLDDWLSEVFGQQIPALDELDRRSFTAQFDQTRNDLEAFEFRFALFLPDDDEALPVRAEALSHWCRGFLYGMGSLAEGVACSAESKEVLRDIYQIADLESRDLSEEDEDAYTELTEYLRVGVQLLRFEFRAPDAKRLH